MIEDIVTQTQKVNTALSAVATARNELARLTLAAVAVKARVNPESTAEEVEAATKAVHAATALIPYRRALAYDAACTLKDLADVIVKQLEALIKEDDLDVYTKDFKVTLSHGIKTELDAAAITKTLLKTKRLDDLVAAASYTQESLKKIRDGEQIIKDCSAVVAGPVKINSGKLSKDDQVTILPRFDAGIDFIVESAKPAKLPSPAVPAESGPEGTTPAESAKDPVVDQAWEAIKSAIANAQTQDTVAV
jgi:hypothetical protein